MMNTKKKILEFCKGLGLTSIGFTECRVFHELKEFYNNRKKINIENEFEEQEIEKRINPFLYMENGKTIISIAFPYYYEESRNTQIYFSKYTLGNDYHKVVSKYLEAICKHISTLGGKATYFVDSNALPERYISFLCGVGFIGKNNMLITKEYGSYVFLGEIITDLEIEWNEPMKPQCGECELCFTACPTKSINKSGSNPNICLSYVTQSKHIEDHWLSMFGGRIFGCDTCQDVCPFNKGVSASHIEEFQPYDFMKDINEEEILNMSKKDFNNKYKLTSCGWRGKNIIQRNLLINMFKLNKLCKKEKFSISSPYIHEYYDRLLKSSEN